MWLAQFPDLKHIDDAAWKQSVAELKSLSVPSGTTIFQCGDPCQNFLLVCAGSVKVISLSPEGREVVLYHVGSGQTCILTTSCLLGETEYPAHGITEGEVRAMTMPKAVFSRLLAESPGFRRFVFSQIGGRMARLMYLVQEIAFDRTHMRLARKLGEIADQNGLIQLTHAELAVELGTVREVVSRLLKDFERKGLVKLSRGDIRILDFNSLENLSTM